MRNEMNDELRQRLSAVRQIMNEREVDGLLIGSEYNRRWLSGFPGSAGQLLVTQSKAILATDFRYWEQATAQAPAFTLFKHQRRKEDTAKFFAAAGVVKIGVEGNHVTLAEWGGLRKVEGVTWKVLPGIVESLRKVKSAAEIEAIRAAAAITDQAMAQVNKLARPGMTERALAWGLEKVMREAGAEAAAFTVIVASGPNSALPHYRPGARLLQPGDTIIVDMGAQLNGYNSDLTRTFYLGNEPDEQFWQVYDLVMEAQTAALDNIKPGLKCKEADALARDIITAAGHGEHFGHGLGHGVGLEVHEAPTLSFRSEKEMVATGMVTTVEPGVYLPGWGGARIEDLAHVTETGVKLLSQCPKRPVIHV